MLQRYLMENCQGGVNVRNDIDKSFFDKSIQHTPSMDQQVKNSRTCNHQKNDLKLPHSSPPNSGYGKACFEDTNFNIDDTSSDFSDRPQNCFRNATRISTFADASEQKCNRKKCAKINNTQDKYKCPLEKENDSKKFNDYPKPFCKKDYEDNSSNCDSYCDFLWHCCQCPKKTTCPKSSCSKSVKFCAKCKRKICKKCGRKKKSNDFFKSFEHRPSLNVNNENSMCLEKCFKQLQDAFDTSSMRAPEKTCARSPKKSEPYSKKSQETGIKTKKIDCDCFKCRKLLSQDAKKYKNKNMSQPADKCQQSGEIDGSSISSTFDTSSTLTPEKANRYSNEKKEGSQQSDTKLRNNKNSVPAAPGCQKNPKSCVAGPEAYEEISALLNGNWMTMRIMKKKSKTNGADNKTKENLEISSSARCGESPGAIGVSQNQTNDCNCDSSKEKSTSSCCITPRYPIVSRKQKKINTKDIKLDKEGCYKACGQKDGDLFLLQLCTKKSCGVKEHTVDMELILPKKTPCQGDKGKSTAEICARQSQTHGAKIDRAVAGCKLPPPKDPCDYWPSRITSKTYRKFLRTQRLYN